jgi:hypothetical protein
MNMFHTNLEDFHTHSVAKRVFLGQMGAMSANPYPFLFFKHFKGHPFLKFTRNVSQRTEYQRIFATETNTYNINLTMKHHQNYNPQNLCGKAGKLTSVIYCH